MKFKLYISMKFKLYISMIFKLYISIIFKIIYFNGISKYALMKF